MKTVKLVTEITCNADDAYFEAEAPQWVLDECKENGPIPCEGKGPAEWCRDCRFCDSYQFYFD